MPQKLAGFSVKATRYGGREDRCRGVSVFTSYLVQVSFQLANLFAQRTVIGDREREIRLFDVSVDASTRGWATYSVLRSCFSV